MLPDEIRSANSAAMNKTKMAATRKNLLKNSESPSLTNELLKANPKFAAGAVAAETHEQQRAQCRDARVADEAAAFGGHEEVGEHQHEAEADHRNFQTDIIEGCVHENKTPNSNIQAPEKLQDSNAKPFTRPPAWSLVLEVSLELGAWSLMLFISVARQRRQRSPLAARG